MPCVGEPTQTRPVEIVLSIAANVDINQLIGLRNPKRLRRSPLRSRPWLTTMPGSILGDNHDMLMPGSTRKVAVAWR